MGVSRSWTVVQNDWGSDCTCSLSTLRRREQFHFPLDEKLYLPRGRFSCCCLAKRPQRPPKRRPTRGSSPLAVRHRDCLPRRGRSWSTRGHFPANRQPPPLRWFPSWSMRASMSFWISPKRPTFSPLQIKQRSHGDLVPWPTAATVLRHSSAPNA